MSETYGALTIRDRSGGRITVERESGSADVTVWIGDNGGPSVRLTKRQQAELVHFLTFGAGQ